MSKSWTADIGADGKTFGERLSDLMKGRQISQKKLSNETKIPASALSEYVNADPSVKKPRSPDCATFRTLAKFFDVPYAYLFGDIPSADPKNYDAALEFGFSDKTANLLREMNCKEQSSSAKMLNGVRLIFNRLFENGFADLLLDTQLLFSNLSEIEDTMPPDITQALSGRKLVDTKQGMVAISKKHYLEYETLRIERTFGELLRKVISEIYSQSENRKIVGNTKAPEELQNEQ